MDDDASALVASLDAQRAHVVGILDGLPAEALLRPVLPTGWSCLGLVQHLALDVEQFWFRQVAAGEPVEAADDATSAWQVAADTPPDVVFERYRQEIERANAIIAATPMDAEPRAWPEWWPDWRLADLRAITLHVITETACHAGHLDAARELLDGHTWLILTS